MHTATVQQDPQIPLTLHPIHQHVGRVGPYVLGGGGRHWDWVGIWRQVGDGGSIVGIEAM